jgi:hypothetical protein
MLMQEMTMMIKMLNGNSCQVLRYLILLIILCSGDLRVDAQQKDFQAWPSLQVNIEVVNNFRLHLEEEIRFHENLSQVSRQINDAGVSYRFNKYLKAGIFYRLEADWKYSGEYAWRNGLYTDISARTNVNRFIIGYRLRLQSSKVERNDDESALFNGFRHRHKISAEYDIKGIPLVPFIDSELFVDYSAHNHSEIRGFRMWIGLDYSINKIHTLSVKYGIDQDLNTSDPLRAYIIAVGYALDLSLLSAE